MLMLTVEQGEDIIQEASDDYDVVEDVIVGHRRWTVTHRCVFRDKTTQALYAMLYENPATEAQEHPPFGGGAPVAIAVRAVEKTITAYEPF